MGIDKHGSIVSQLSMKIGRKLKLPDEQLVKLTLAAFFHDVGKIFIPRDILYKPDVLTIQERVLIENHPNSGTLLLKENMHISDTTILKAVLHHHEKFNGSGYPDKLAGNDIPLFARIISLADAYDAMTSERPYKPRILTHKEVCEEISSSSGTHFDPELVEIFLTIIAKKRQ